MYPILARQSVQDDRMLGPGVGTPDALVIKSPVIDSRLTLSHIRQRSISAVRVVKAMASAPHATRSLSSVEGPARAVSVS
jgi:hypothetical protein